jgi:phenylacetate-CoA ligase
MSFFDDLETRSADQRANDLAVALPAQIANAQKLSGYADALGDIDASSFQTIDDLTGLPVLRKSDLVHAQSENGPFGGYGALNTHDFAHIFQSPGPIYEPGGVGYDWWRIGRFLNAVGIGAGDIV